jgi:hypothetical protein
MILRAGPLRQLWEARGPGLMQTLDRTIDYPVALSEARINCVYPITGGGGISHVSHGVATIEAVLANPWDQLPEVARLGWLLIQLRYSPPGTDVTLYETPGISSSQVLALALIPAVINAAQHMELAQYHPRTIELAISQWMVPRPDNAAQLAAVLDDWWQRHAARASAWPESLAALHQAIAALTRHESA